MSIPEKYKNIFYHKEFEVVPKWKQSGEYNLSWSDDEKYLWDSGCYDHHMELVSLDNPEKDEKFFERNWYVWKNYRCGFIWRTEDDEYQVEMQENMIGWSSGPYKTLEEAVDYIILCYYAREKYYKNKKETD